MKRVIIFSLVSLIAYNQNLTGQEGESGFKSINITKDERGNQKSQLDVSSSQPKNVIILADIDENIPESVKTFPDRYALIIGNEDYKAFQTNLSSEANVAFAERDAKLFNQYAQKTLGVPSDNILFEVNVGHIEMVRMFEKLNLIIKHTQGQAEVYVYYAGHGFPDMDTKTPHLMPVDVSATDLQYAIKLKDIYASLTEYPSKRVTVFLDACFSGGGRDLGLLAVRAVKVKPKEESIIGNLIVFSASSEEQAALPYKEKQHGIFTYYLLKKIQETEGETTYQELYDYVNKNVAIKSVMINNLEQTPKLNISPSVGEKWKSWTIK